MDFGLNVAFCLMGVDKWKAKHGRWRLPEKVLFLSALAGGAWAPCWYGLFRHKTRHWTFRLGMPAILILQVAALDDLDILGCFPPIGEGLPRGQSAQATAPPGGDLPTESLLDGEEIMLKPRLR